MTVSPGLLVAQTLCLVTGLGVAACSGAGGAGRIGVVWPQRPPLAEGLEPLGPVADADAANRIARLDLVLDLFDAARFAQDAAARADLWEALGGAPPKDRGPEATREAAARMLEEATAIEDRFGPKLDEDAAAFLADVIMLLSVDVNTPYDAEAVEIQALAFKSLLEVGHARVVDNARWRLYDHLRSVMEAAASSPPQRRVEIGVHALYLEHESIEPWLADRAVHVRPPLPTRERFFALADAMLASLEEDPRWRQAVARRRSLDAEVREAFAQTWPANRSALPALSRLRGTGRPDHHAPVVQLSDQTLTVNAGQPHAQDFRRGDPRVADAITQAVLADGGGRMLVAASAETGAPLTHDLLTAAGAARVAWLEIALREPRLQAEGAVVTQLPLRVVHTEDRGPEARALRDARLKVILSGRGATVVLDDQAVDEAPLKLDGLERRLRQLRLAFPREAAIRVELRPDLQWTQLADVIALILGPAEEPAFARVAWWVDGPRVDPRPGGEARLDARIALLGQSTAWQVDQSKPLEGSDEATFVALLERLEACRIESEAAPTTPLAFVLELQDGAVTRAEALTDGPRRDAVQDCLSSEAELFRLRSTPGELRLRIEAQPPA